MMKNIDYFKRLESIVKKLPETPGVYIFKDAKNKVIYVGKANFLRKRVSSYFSGGAKNSYLTEAMLKELADIDFVIVKSGIEALIIENQFIKQNQPKYNILLKDDKNYPYIRLTIKEDYPRAYLSRSVGKDGALYFGPYIPAMRARKLLYLIYRYFGIRQCSLDIGEKRKEVCLLYHIKRCSGPCAHYISKEDYRERAEHVRMFLEGKDQDIISYLEGKMLECSKNLQYETALIYRDAIEAVRQLEQKVNVFSSKLEDCDIFGYWIDNNSVAVSVLQMRKGNIVSKREYFVKDKLWSSEDTLLADLIFQYYMGSFDVPPIIYIPKVIKDIGGIESWLQENREIKVKFIVPKDNNKKGLLQLSIKNAQNSFNLNKDIQEGNYAIELREIKEILGLPNLLKRIEAVDISHIYGSYTVGAVVVYKTYGFDSSEYKRYKVRSNVKADDYFSLEEVLDRHLYHIEKGETERPDLLIVDGGIGQLNVALKTMEKHKLKIPAISIAKKKEEIYIPNSDIPLILSKHSSALKVIQKIRDEAHRFVISYHKRIRSKAMKESILDKIRGIGSKRKKELLNRFKSINGIREASLDELVLITGRKVAQELKSILENMNNEN